MVPQFSICLIMRNESKVLPRLLSSLKEFMDNGGDVNCLDTGSTDESVKIATDAGCKVEEVGEKYLKTISRMEAQRINQRFVVDNEPLIVKEGDKYFQFDAARNHAASMAKNDFVFFYDADEVSVQMDIQKINEFIENGCQQFEYFFVFAYDPFGKEAVKFMQCKAFDRRVMFWAGIVHELVTPLNEKSEIKRQFLDESIYKLGHHQNQESGRHTYLVGLAVDCFNHPNADRQSHYFARELMWSQRYKSAIKEFKKHISLDRWAAEKAQSMIYIGDCYGFLNQPEVQAEYYSKSFYVDSSRREALLKLANFFLHNKNYMAAICYAKASLEIGYTGFYASDMRDYTITPHSILYQSYGWIGKIDEAQKHLLICLEHQPYNEEFLRDTQFYFEYWDRGIRGWMRFPELQFLYNEAKKHKVIVEGGSWCGRSTHALLSGCKDGTVTAVDTWQGSTDEKDDTNWQAKKEDIFAIFKTNTQGFNNLKVIRKTSEEASRDFQDGSIDMMFIDMGHDFDSVVNDIRCWKNKVKKGGILAGHDYTEGTWQKVVEAVRQELGEPDKIVDSIWVKYIN